MAEVIVAVDVGNREEALRIVDALDSEVEFFKVGLELFTACGPTIVDELRTRGCRVFLDLKLHDIPNTVRGAARSAAALGADLLTVHATGGDAMVSAAAEGVSGSETRILAVTVLTSLDARGLSEAWGRGEVDPRSEVLRLAASSIRAGADGVVCAPGEAAAVRREIGPDPSIVTPGIRPRGAAVGDQARVSTPGDAVAAGADFLVVGRPVTRADDPLSAYREILREARDATRAVDGVGVE